MWCILVHLLVVQTDTYKFVDNLGKLKEKGIEKVIFMVPSMTHLLWMSGTSYMVINKSMRSGSYRRVYYKNE